MVRVNLAWNPYLFGCVVLFVFWAVGLVVARRRGGMALRRGGMALREFWWASFACALLGITEPLFVPEYWSPPSIFQVGRFDFESFPFCFAVGGITAVFPEAPWARAFFSAIVDALSAVMGRVRRGVMAFLAPGSAVSAPASAREPREALVTRSEIAQDNLILLAVFLGAFGATAHLGLNVIYDSSIVCVIVAALIAWWRPALRWQILSGGATFTIIYAVTLRVVGAVYPTFYTDHWNLGALSGRFILGAPAEEYLFALTLGFLWSPLYETWKHVQRAPVAPSASLSAGAP